MVSGRPTPFFFKGNRRGWSVGEGKKAEGLGGVAGKETMLEHNVWEKNKSFKKCVWKDSSVCSIYLASMRTWHTGTCLECQRWQDGSWRKVNPWRLQGQLAWNTWWSFRLMWYPGPTKNTVKINWAQTLEVVPSTQHAHHAHVHLHYKHTHTHTDKYSKVS